MVQTDVSATQWVVTAQPNVSLSYEHRLLCFAAIAATSLLVALLFAYHGIWMILPFAGLEIVALGWAFHHLNCHARDFERITFDANSITIETHDHKNVYRTELQRYWVRVILRESPITRRVRLYLRSHGREIEVGRFMNDEERASLARQMRASL